MHYRIDLAGYFRKVEMFVFFVEHRTKIKTTNLIYHNRFYVTKLYEYLKYVIGQLRKIVPVKITCHAHGININYARTTHNIVFYTILTSPLIDLIGQQLIRKFTHACTDDRL